MVYGSELKGSWLPEGAIVVALVSVRLVNSYFPNSFLLVGGERATFHARTRYHILMLVPICSKDSDFLYFSS